MRIQTQQVSFLRIVTPNNFMTKNTKPSNSNKIILEATHTLISGYSGKQFSRSLRKLLLDYIAQNRNYLPLDFDLFLNDINMLLDFLNTLEDQHIE